MDRYTYIYTFGYKDQSIAGITDLITPNKEVKIGSHLKTMLADFARSKKTRVLDIIAKTYFDGGRVVKSKASFIIGSLEIDRDFLFWSGVRSNLEKNGESICQIIGDDAYSKQYKIVSDRFVDARDNWIVTINVSSDIIQKLDHYNNTN